jgi:hypothetical protein
VPPRRHMAGCLAAPRSPCEAPTPSLSQAAFINLSARINEMDLSEAVSLAPTDAQQLSNERRRASGGGGPDCRGRR